MAAARELQVQIANEPGALGRISELLGEHGINIHGFAVWGATAHLLVGEPAKAAEILRDQRFELRVVDVLELIVPDEPGNLAEIARALGEAGVNIDYRYTVSSTTRGAAAFVLAVADTDQAEQLLD